MVLAKYALAAFVACVLSPALALAQCGCTDSVCGCESVSSCDTMDDCGGGGCDDFCGGGCDDFCGGGCDDSCGGGCDCDLGDPFLLFEEHCGWSAGGWVQMGYHNKANVLFNSRPDEFQLHQAWLYAEKAIDTSCGFDLGGRIDYLYGTDSQDTQAFGAGRGYDNGWDNGPDYGHALPQVYLEAGYGDLAVKVGNFYTIIGWEVVGATGNFFYSHAYTMYNSEPFTHTGALATLSVSDDLSVWAGYTLGWDSGFNDNGDVFLGGFSATLTEDLTLIYASTGGRFGEAKFGADERGYMHSIVLDFAATDSLQYIFQSDLLTSEDVNDTTVRDTFGINQYLIKTVNDCLALGLRFEWWNAQLNGPSKSDVYDLTLGANYKPHANVTVRPEIRWDWDRDQNGLLENNDDEQTTFGIDTVVTF